jgi:tetratricopeptide (TPR) repeat protein
MEVLPLPQNEARKLALALMVDADAATRRLCEVIARESGGNPYFIDALVQEQRTEEHLPDRQARSQPIDLDEMLWARTQKLPPHARRVLEVIAVAGRPLHEADACAAAALVEDTRETLAVLRSTSMIRITGGQRGDEIETYHDRIRETVVAHLPSETLVHHHRRLAKALEASGQADPAVLAGHFLRAGERERAGAHFADAASKSAETLAFDRAAQLYRQAVELCPPGTAEERGLRRKLADALSNAGRGAEAAKEYLAVATGATAAESLELRRCAAMQSLISGHIDEGLAALRTVLRAAGVKYPATSRRAFGSLLLRRALIRLRGLRFRQRDPSQVAADKLTKIDVCWSATIGLSVVDPIRGADFQARGLLLALQSGEPNRIARSLATEAGHVATAGGRTRHRVERLLAKADALSQELDSRYADGFNLLIKGIAAFLQGRWRRSVECSDSAETTFRNHCTGVAWELNTAQIFSEWSLFWMGEIVEMARRLPLQLAEARKRGNLYASTNLGTFARPLVSLAADDPDAAHEELRELMSRWSRQGFHVQHNTFVLGQTQIDIYRGETHTARQRLAEHWPALAASLLLRVQQVRIYMRHLRARAALAEAEQATHPGPLLRAARADARRLDREKMDWATALAQLIRAGISSLEGDRSRTAAFLNDAVARLDEVDMQLFAAAARRRLGELTGGDAGRELIARGDSWMATQNIQNPERMTAVHVPGIRRLR